MKVSFSWLKEFLDVNLPPLHLAKLLTSLGLEVEGLEEKSLGFSHVVIGKVLEVQKHPNADKLLIARVTDGENISQVVCGAPNCRSELLTAFALVGATLTDMNGKQFKVKKSEIRGVESYGMLCSGFELGLGYDQEGILEFDSHLEIGADIAAIYGDTIFDISLTPNLNHCSSLLGVARELSALTRIPFKVPKIVKKEKTQEHISDFIKVNVYNQAKCPRYACRLLRGVKVGPSPNWMQDRLQACGIRPINNVVDITNYVLLEMGHPLHAFDAKKINGMEIQVREANDRETFVTLDEQPRLMAAGDLLICDAKQPVAIAGVMGGRNSEVSSDTVDVIIESAYFQPSSIRKTSKRLGLQTESSKRFERGCDPNQVIVSLDRAAMLMSEICGGVVIQGVIDISTQEFKERSIHCRLDRINKILGTQFSIGEVEEIFHRLLFKTHWDGENTFLITVPTYRVDISSEIDLIEEAARIYGFDNIPKRESRHQTSKVPNAPIYVFEKEIRRRLLSEGLQEFLTCDLISPKDVKLFEHKIMGEESIIRVLNPTSIEQSVLRHSLLPGLLMTVKHNLNHSNLNISGFEVGKIHFKEGDQYRERSVAGIILSGATSPKFWKEKSRDFDYYDLKGILENIFLELRVEKPIFKNLKMFPFHSGRQASIFVNGLEVGTIGEVHPSILHQLDISQRVIFGELNLHGLYDVSNPKVQYKELAIYPASDRDWTIAIPKELPIRTILDRISENSSHFVETVSLIDIYEGEKCELGKKNATFRFIYRDRKKTISQERVDAEHQRITEKVLASIK